ncbi:hypothetical protein Taro_028489 [Colocasia esculenta]|uniref:Uncharacterized protein n=1 Tax=Colocasia esculenta TaxID=4460 RepID=A0A843VL77_COLES|nr:hypothetical protein [Colocasia esculenta]
MLCMAPASGALALAALVEYVAHGRQLDLSSMTARLRGVELVGLHSSLACACGAAVGPFIPDYETER